MKPTIQDDSQRCRLRPLLYFPALLAEIILLIVAAVGVLLSLVRFKSVGFALAGWAHDEAAKLPDFTWYFDFSESRGQEREPNKHEKD